LHFYIGNRSNGLIEDRKSPHTNWYEGFELINVRNAQRLQKP
jgi:hypothetical protein